MVDLVRWLGMQEQIGVMIMKVDFEVLKKKGFIVPPTASIG